MKKVHQVIRIGQSYWMKPYIILNIKLSAAAKNEFEKDFSKHINNSVFEKIMKHIRNQKGMQLLTSQKEYLKYLMGIHIYIWVPIFEVFICCKDGKNWYQDEKAIIPWRSNIGPNKNINLWDPLFLHAA